MGNTVRREPVNFNIPASPNYKFLNITNFRGLDVSSNPFELATNTASDCLNVYVDETNTLTTRPRLCKKEFKNANGDFIVPLGGTCIGVYNLHNGYLLHHLIDDKPIMRLFVDGVLKEPVSGDLIPTTQCKHFEHGEEIYLLTGSDYLVIKDNVISKVVGYVPNISIVDKKGQTIPDESLNILSDKYTTKYYWDGRYAPDINLLSENLEQSVYKNKVPDIFVGKTVVCIYADNSVLTHDSSTNELFYTTMTTSFNEISTIKLPVTNVREALSGKQTKQVWFVDTENRINLCDFTHISDIKTYKGDSITIYYDLVAVSDDNARFMTRHSASQDDAWQGVYEYRAYYFSSLMKDIFYHEFTGLSPHNYMPAPYVTIHYAFNKYNYVAYTKQILFLADETDKQFVKFDDFADTTPVDDFDGAAGITSDTSILYCAVGNKVFYYTNLSKDSKLSISDVKSVGFFWNGTKSYAYGLERSTVQYNEWFLWLYPRFPNTSGAYIVGTVGESFLGSYVFGKGYFDVNNYILDSFNGIFTPTQGTFRVYDSNGVVKKHHELLPTEELAVDLHKKREYILKSSLFTRFNNNYWFAKDNYVHISQKNDPTYFPATEYDDLGDANDDITGFNIANDTTLLAYKTHRVYLIQPFTSSVDTTKYSVTESKNTVGNMAIGAPIVTTLTEMPLQINYDGIYGLSQLQNVSAVERIADLMSESINDRWLNEDDKVIKKAMTLNRLYWTYIILPYDDVAKIYLLDNRTNSWYYWELPIKLLTAFAKDNRAEFVDTDGNIYYLTTTDIKNAGFDTQLVTEYYDDGKKLINWFWQSQILPMGTMNYAKRLVNTTFILTDTDTQDGYGLKYNFKVFRKLASSTPEKEITDELNLVRSTTKKTNISKFGFIQLKISNITEESQGTEAEKAYRNNKLRLVGLGLKYVLLEGLIR